MTDLSFYKDKKVFITGHTGFKGAWLCEILLALGAKVSGYALEAKDPSLFRLYTLEKRIHSYIGDIRDYDKLYTAIQKEQPEIIFHMAAQAIVQEGYTNPKDTYDINFMGTINVLESIRQIGCVHSFVNVTTDKVYMTQTETHYEDDPLDGYDPYSNSKSCSELATSTYKRCYFDALQIPVSTVRSGNAIGGGDFGEHRILSDCIRAILNNEELILRNPHSIRPYYHVYDALYGYLLLAKAQYENPSLSGAYNVGPDKEAYVNTETLVSRFAETYRDAYDYQLAYRVDTNNWPKEANALILDTSKMKQVLNYTPQITLQEALQEIAEWTYLYKQNLDTEEHIISFINKTSNR